MQYSVVPRTLQNIDTLERLAGLPEDKVVEAHGSYYTSHCMGCQTKYCFQWMKGQLTFRLLNQNGCFSTVAHSTMHSLDRILKYTAQGDYSCDQ